MSINKQNHILHGNKQMKDGYKYLYWNCDRGFLGKSKIEDIRNLVQNQNIHILGISEVELSHKIYSFEDIQELYKIENYQLILPSSWNRHGKARIIVYVRHDIFFKKIEDHVRNDDIQHVLLEVGFGKGKHFVDMYYREWKSCISGSSNQTFHLNYLYRLTNILRTVASKEGVFSCFGDTYLDYFKKDDPSYIHKEIAEMFRDFLFEENFFQLIDEITRVRKVKGTLQTSCLDHVTVNCVSKISQCSVFTIGDSDHKSLIVHKRCKDFKHRRRCNKRRTYKFFEKQSFLASLRYAKDKGDFEKFYSATDVDEAFSEFSAVFSSILDAHAPVKIIQQHNNYIPYISDELKQKMKF